MGRRLRDVLAVLLFTLLFAAGIKSCVMDAYRIPSASMSGTIVPGDLILVNKFLYGARTPEKFLYVRLPQFRFPALASVARGDVIVFDFPGEPDEVLPVRNQPLVKRCVGLPGDTVEVAQRNLIINGYRDPRSFSQYDTVPFRTVVPFAGMTVSLDAVSFREWSVFIQREGHTAERRKEEVLIDGRPAASYTVERDYYFAVGDNAKNSYDSRSWGFIPAENIIGRAMLVYWSRGDDGIRWERIGKIIQ